MNDADGVGSRRGRFFRVLRRGWRRYRLTVAAAVVAATLVLGFVGFGAGRGSGAASSHPVADRVYNTLQLFNLGNNGSPPYPAALEVARWLALLLVGYAGARALRALFAEQWTRVRVRVMARNHLIVCGLGQVGLRLAVGFHQIGTSVVAIDQDASGSEVDECRDRGIPLLIGDATDRQVLGRARLDRARLVVAACGDDGTNADLALLVRTMAGQRRRRLRCLVHIGDERLCQLLEESAIAETAHDAVQTEFFNVNRAGPAALFDRYSAVMTEEGSKRAHLVIALGGRLGGYVVAEALRRWRPSAAGGDGAALEGPVRITVVAPEAAEWVSDLVATHTGLEDFAEVIAVASDPADADDLLVLPLGVGDSCFATTAVVCLDDDSAVLRATIRLRGVLPEDVPVIACTSGRSGVATLLGGSGAAVLPNVSGFSLLDDVLRPDVILNDAMETLARAIHAAYQRREASNLPPGDPALASWETLSEHFKDANRAQAADIGHKLDLVGLKMVRAAGWDPPITVMFTDDELDRLSQLEHVRWMDEKRREGWVVGPTKDAERRTHPSMVPWAELSEGERAKDRETVREIPGFLAGIGYAVVRKSSPSIS